MCVCVGRGRGVGEVRTSKRREGGVLVGVRGSERGTDSVPTLLITVSLETERGLPLALGNSLGPVAEREQQWWREEGVELKRVYDTGTLSLCHPFLFGFTLLPPLLCPNTPTSHLRPTSPQPSLTLLCLGPLFPLRLCSLSCTASFLPPSSSFLKCSKPPPLPLCVSLPCLLLT